MVRIGNRMYPVVATNENLVRNLSTALAVSLSTGPALFFAQRLTRQCTLACHYFPTEFLDTGNTGR
jgi:hypothetical protein